MPAIFLPVCEFTLRAKAVDHAYKHIRERFSYEKYYYDQQNGPGGPIIVRAGSKKDDTVLGVVLVDYVKLFKGPFY